MKEKLHTIPVNDAFQAGEECPFCYVERKLEEHMLDFVLGPGASYMEDDVRAETDKAGFCRMHYKKLYDYGNRLGTGLILKTHFKKLNEELAQQIKSFAPAHQSLFDKLRRGKSDTSYSTNLGAWAASKQKSCYICDSYQANFDRYMDTFLEMYQKDPEVKRMFAESKGMCIPHFGDLVEKANQKLSDKEKKEFFDVLLPLMKSNMERLYDDLDWFCDKFDYRNKDADWKTSKDAIPRGMQKAAGINPDLPPHIMKR